MAGDRARARGGRRPRPFQQTLRRFGRKLKVEELREQLT